MGGRVDREGKGSSQIPQGEQPSSGAAARFEKLPGEAPHEMDARAMKAFAHPLRMAMYTYLSDHGAATSTMLAQHLGESTGQTSYHLRQLETHGLVEEDSGRGTGRERWWKPISFSIRRAFVEPDGATSAQLDVLMGHQLQDRFEKLRAWLGHHEEETPEWRDASVDTTSTAQLTSAQARALSRELMEVVERHTDAAQQEDSDAAQQDHGRSADPAEDGNSAEAANIAEEGNAPEAGDSAEAGERGDDARRFRVYVSAFPLPD